MSPQQPFFNPPYIHFPAPSRTLHTALWYFSTVSGVFFFFLHPPRLISRRPPRTSFKLTFSHFTLFGVIGYILFRKFEVVESTSGIIFRGREGIFFFWCRMNTCFSDESILGFFYLCIKTSLLKDNKTWIKKNAQKWQKWMN